MLFGGFVGSLVFDGPANTVSEVDSPDGETVQFSDLTESEQEEALLLISGDRQSLLDIETTLESYHGAYLQTDGEVYLIHETIDRDSIGIGLMFGSIYGIVGSLMVGESSFVSV
jgi:hypothetical protein